MSDLKGKNAIITGASKGIGKAVAMSLAEKGINVLIAARTQGPLDSAVAEIKEKTTGVNVIGLSTDVSKLKDLQKLTDTALKEFGQIDILVNNAGVSSQYPFEKQPLEDLERLAHTNYLGYVRLIRLVIPHMIERKSGAIINMVSGSTLCDPLPKNFITYSSLKVGLRAFLKGLFWEMRDHGIKVTSILPGVVDTELTGKLKDITEKQNERLMKPKDVVDMVMFALSAPQNACPLELTVINQQTPWTKPVIDYTQSQAK
ncbi:MAG: SDR family oxidoreductase [Candidatus Omnitrophica bacterium]|nr:SDR family oxidoreductase [Candidatus Omnitrophota bacterium]